MSSRRSRRVQTSASSNDNRTRNYIIFGAIAVGIIGLGYLLYLSIREEPPIEGIVTYPRPSRGHDNTLEIPFGELPPVGGTHDDVWQNCGIYDEPVLPQNAIHSMEHGAVWLTYQTNLPAAQVDVLKGKVRGNTFVLMSPYPEQRSPITLSAWGVQLEVDSADDDRIEEFIQRYEVGPQTPERGATCSRGLGEPDG